MVFALTRDKQQKVSQIRQMGTSNRPLYRSVHSELFQISAPTQIEGDLKHFDVSMWADKATSWILKISIFQQRVPIKLPNKSLN